MDKQIFKDISYGMYIVTTTDKNNKNIGCVINTLTQITSNEPIIAISLNKDNYTNKIIKKNMKFAVSILNTDVTMDLISEFGFKSSEHINKFENIKYKFIDNTCVLTENTIGYIICDVIKIVDCDTHDLFIGKVINSEVLNDSNPITYEYYHKVLKAAGLTEDLDKFPEITYATSEAGKLNETSAAEMGLVPGIPVFGGFGDLAAITVGTGCCSNNMVHIYMGTSSWLVQLTKERIEMMALGIETLTHLPDPLKRKLNKLLIICRFKRSQNLHVHKYLFVRYYLLCLSFYCIYHVFIKFFPARRIFGQGQR